MIPASFILIALASWGPVRPGETQNMLLLIAANAVLWIVGVSAAINIRPRQGRRIVAGAAMSFGSAVLAVMLLMH